MNVPYLAAMYDWKFIQNRDQWGVDMITIHRFLSHQWLENSPLGQTFSIIGSFGTYDSYSSFWLPCLFLLPDSSRTKEGQSIIIIISESARIFVRHDFSSGIHNNVDVPPRALLRPKTTVPPYWAMQQWNAQVPNLSISVGGRNNSLMGPYAWHCKHRAGISLDPCESAYFLG